MFSDRLSSISSISSRGTKKVSKWLDHLHRIAPKIRYMVVPELHKDGAYHFHGLTRIHFSVFLSFDFIQGTDQVFLVFLTPSEFYGCVPVFIRNIRFFTKPDFIDTLWEYFITLTFSPKKVKSRYDYNELSKKVSKWFH